MHVDSTILCEIFWNTLKMTLIKMQEHVKSYKAQGQVEKVKLALRCVLNDRVYVF